MSHTVLQKAVPSSDGIHMLAGVVYKPTCEIRGLFHLVHGMTEYIGRYAHIFAALADAGFLCFGYDNLGHGKTVRNMDELGFIAHKNGYDFLVRDVAAFETAIRSEYPDLPLVLMGHSMGSFIVRLAAERHGDSLAGLVICGTGGPQPAAPLGLLASDIIRLFRGEKHISPMIENMAFGAYNKRFEHQSKYDWLTKDREIITKYENDPFCTFHFTVSAMHDLVKLNALCNRGAWFHSLKKDLPVLLISGADDPVGDYGKGVQKVYDGLCTAGMTDVTLRLFPDCRHEIHNDTCKAEDIALLTEFAERTTHP